MKKLSGFLIFVLSFPLLMLYKAFVFLQLWEWFLSPIYSISFASTPQVAGAFLIIVLIKSGSAKDYDVDDFLDFVVTKIFQSVFLSTVTLLFGYMISFYI